MDNIKEKTEFISNEYYKNYKTRQEWIAHIELQEIYITKLTNINNNLRKILSDNLSWNQCKKIDNDKVYKLLDDWEDTFI